MPNHIKNRLTITGPGTDELIAKYSTDYPRIKREAHNGNLIFKNSTDCGWLDSETNHFTTRTVIRDDAGKFLDSKLITISEDGPPEGWKQEYAEAWTLFPDFEKILPTPEYLKNFSPHCALIDAARYRLNANNRGGHVAENMVNDMLIERAGHREFSIEEEELIFKCIKAYKETGYFYWYDYNIATWGTKWNAYTCKQVEHNVFTFETAWSGVPELLSLMLVDFPEVKIFYEYADEDTGYNCGMGYLPDINPLENRSVAAYELVFSLRPDWKDDYILKDGEYVCKEE